MPDKQLTIATYAAGASLAAITLVYVFAPTFFIDGDAGGGSGSSRKRCAVGLSNPANDCFINSVLQALAGLGDLRLYLIRETHRRKLDGEELYMNPVQNPAREGMPAWKIVGLQNGMVTQGLKEVIDALNERPLYKKTISAGRFVSVLEAAFKQRISRQQQDAQEFLQVVAERLCDEYHAGHRARKDGRKIQNGVSEERLDEESVDRRLQQLADDGDHNSAQAPTILEPEASSPTSNEEGSESTNSQGQANDVLSTYNDEDGFPLEGGSESQIECLTCGFKPKATETTFCSITLSVPQVSSTSLSSCFDGMFKTEYIEDFKCEKCRLVHALQIFQDELASSNSEKFKIKTQQAIDRLKVAIGTNAEEELKDVELPDNKFAPKRKIAKHARITKFPKIMAIHLSRSIFDATRSTMKNSAKVSFPERLPLGGLLNQRMYRLSSVVCHKGSHHSGHYESFRRQAVFSPFSTQLTFHTAGVYSQVPSPLPSQISTPQIRATQEAGIDSGNLPSTPELLSPTSASSSSLPYTNGTPPGELSPSLNGRPVTSRTSVTTSSDTTTRQGPTFAPRDSDSGSLRSLARSTKSKLSRVSSSHRSTPSTPSPVPLKKGETAGTGTTSSATTAPTKTTTLSSVGDAVRGKRKKANNKWWRISDDKIKESKTSDVLNMQREVYMLFYELEKEGEVS
jgi:ubiquitin carboxyl-terminal hydrolase 16